jgi:hypothetical protein
LQIRLEVFDKVCVSDHGNCGAESCAVEGSDFPKQAHSHTNTLESSWFVCSPKPTIRALVVAKRFPQFHKRPTNTGANKITGILNLNNINNEEPNVEVELCVRDSANPRDILIEKRAVVISISLGSVWLQGCEMGRGAAMNTFRGQYLKNKRRGRKFEDERNRIEKLIVHLRVEGLEMLRHTSRQWEEEYRAWL